MDKIDARSLLNLKFSTNPTFSPDGTYFVYVHTTVHEEENKYHSILRKVDTLTLEDRPFTHGRGVDGFAQDKNPRFSPDGTKLAFLSNRAGKNQVFVMPADGGEPLQLTHFKQGVRSFAWAPDGASIVFAARQEEPENLSDVRVIRQLRYWENGEGFYGDQPCHLWTVEADGTNLKPLTEGPFDEYTPEFSPDGTNVLFRSWRNDDQRSVLSSLYSISVASGDIRQIYEGRGYMLAPMYSPDGKHVAFFGHQHGETSGSNIYVWVVPTEGGEARKLTADFDRPVGNFVGSDARMESGLHKPTWSADGERVYFLATDGGNCHVYSVNLHGEVQQESAGGDEVITSFSLSGSDIVYTKETVSCPSEIYLQRAGTVLPVTRHNESWLGNVELSTPERIEVTTRDGWAVEGWLLKPAGFNPSQKYPLVLEIHGGPHTCYGNAFNHEFQLLTARGYVVLYTNPRGSQGYGDVFVRGCIGDWGGKDYEDLMDAVDYAVQRPYIDVSRLFVTGGSYGGYMANWMVGHTDRFRAAVTQRSISNLYSMFGTSDIGFYFNNMELGGADLWDQEEFVMARSPIRYAPNVTTPVKIIHSEDDIRCPMEQAQQWFIALKRLGVDTELVRFPGENHELSRSGKPKHRLERLEHIVGWFDKYND